MDRIESIALDLKKAEASRNPIGAISKRFPDLAIEDAYRIQLLNIDAELKAGRTITGKKIGLTSLAMQNMLGVNQPDFGHLLDSMEVAGGEVSRSTMIQPKVEGEIAFVLKGDLKGPNVTAKEVLEATDYVVASIEIVDSRVEDWKINIVDTVADNASSCMYAISSRRIDPNLVDLKKVKMEFFKNGEKINEGVGTDVLGDPANCVAWLANTLGDFGVQLKKGDLILSGAFTAALDADAGDVFRASFTELGDIEVKFTE
ncbi:MAG: 2-keto-4-pentenoate hydratase [Tissierellaceae bacterium]